MEKKNIIRQVNEKCEKQMSEGQYSCILEQKKPEASQKVEETSRNKSGDIIGIETPLHFTSF